MKAIRHHRYGPPEVLALEEVAEPIPARGQVRVRVHAASVNPKDVLVRKGKMTLFTGKRFPRVPGYDVAGVVDALGPGVRSFAVGDEVYGMVQAWSAGAYAEAVVMPEGELAPKPKRLSMIEAASIPLAALTALQALRDLLRVRPGQRVLINGASGGVGTLAVQIGSVLGGRVVAIASSKNEELLRELGAHDVAPYDRVSLRELEGPFDAIFDVFGSAPYPKVKRLLGPRGRYVTAIPKPGTVLRDLATRFTRRPARLVVVRSNRPDLEHLARWIDAGKLHPVVDRVLPLADAAEAHRYVETKRARGKVVLQVV
jgi:NADPH:quinone reductase-like Zn-dependent oxidoreductase